MDRLRERNGQIKAVILAGNLDFGRCPVASRLPFALWPVGGKPALIRLLEGLAEQGIREATVCFRGYRRLLEESLAGLEVGIKIDLLEEELPLGSGGCLREVMKKDEERHERLLVCQSNVSLVPQVAELVGSHERSGAILTVTLHKECEVGRGEYDAVGAYLCDSSLRGHFLPAGFGDIKEGLIPRLRSRGLKVHAHHTDRPLGKFGGRQEYLRATALYLQSFNESDADMMRVSDEAEVDDSVRLVGPVMVEAGARLAKNVVVLGPAVIGRNVRVDADTLIDSSVVWEGAEIGASCSIQRCLLDRNVREPDCTQLEDRIESLDNQGVSDDITRRVRSIVGRSKLKIKKTAANTGSAKSGVSLAGVEGSFRGPIVWGGVILLIAFLWSYWATVENIWGIWIRNDEYSSGLLVPIMTMYILWSRRKEITSCELKPSVWGLLGFFGAQAFRFFGMYFMFASAERISLVMSLGAIILFVGGWGLFRKIFTVWLFLFLMLPLPNRVQTAITFPLQVWATHSAVFCLELMGYEVICEGNVIHIGSTTVAVAEACNGLRMLTAFFVVSGLVALLIKRSLWEKLFILISALPIALICNTIRLTGTAIAFQMLAGNGRNWEEAFHDFGGLVMMPLALALVVLELWFLSKIVVQPETEVDDNDGLLVVRGNSGGEVS